MIPAIAAMALVAVVVVIAAVAVFSVGSNDDNESLEVVSERALVPVRASADAADEEASAVDSSADLDAVAGAGARLAGSSESASATLAAAGLTEDENPSRGLLLDVLRETADYGRALEAAARTPNAETIAEVRTQDEDLRDARDALARQAPQLAASVNIATVTLAPIVELLAAEAREADAERQRVSARNTGRAYAERIDSLLRNSAETRADLGALIENIMTGELTAAQSLGQITAIANQRQDLQNSVSAIETPPTFGRSAELLRSSIRASFEDDIAIQGWITAWWEGDSYGIDHFWSEHETASARATAAKSAFVAAYNDARTRVGLAPSIVGTTY